MAVEVGLEDDPTYTQFAHKDQFLDLLGQLLQVDIRTEPSDLEDEQEVKLVDDLGALLDYYLAQPGLLDPSLQNIIPRLMGAISSAVTLIASNLDVPTVVSKKRIGRLGQLVNWIVKIRGWKAIVPYFPSTITYLTSLIQLLSPPTTTSSTTSSSPQHPLLSGQDIWELRATLVLWLALLLTVPFDLAALGESSDTSTNGIIDLSSRQLLFSTKVSNTARDITILTIPLLHCPGKEGTYAALVLVRLFSRSDGVHGLDGFLSWAARELEEGERESEASFVASLLEFLAALPESVPNNHLDAIRSFMDHVLLPHLRGSRTASSSGLIRKLAVKAQGKWWMAVLKQQKHGDELPDGLEEQLDSLMGSLSDKDTIVRYSSAKYLARLSALLPPDLSQQMVQATIQLFGGTDDEPVVETAYGFVVDPGGIHVSDGTLGLGGLELSRGEARWHGCCLAIAEMARRAHVRGEAVAEAVQWAGKALTFDLRKASHSVGANVRDAAAYLIWSLSRACSPGTFAPFAELLAIRLVCVACFDREVGVRRAASAAFQEGVGRLGLYPKGIDVLAHTDFYSVSVRRMAFHNAAPAVARHEVYRNAMIKHLHEITLRHWDSAMQQLAADTLAELLTSCGPQSLEASIQTELGVLPSLDPINVRGALYALGKMCLALPPDSTTREKIVTSVSSIRPAVLLSTQSPDILRAVAHVITGCLSVSNVYQAVIEQMYAKYREANMKRREAECHEAAARLVGRLSQLRDASPDVEGLVNHLKIGSAPQRQAAALALGCVSYRLCPNSTAVSSEALLCQLNLLTKADIETRRAAVTSLSAICTQTSDQDEPLATSPMYRKCHAAFIKALDDYSTDQRGDVGSWVRTAAIAALGRTVTFAAGRSNMHVFISQEVFDRTIGGTVKQGVEKLEPVRAEVWRSTSSMRDAKAAKTWQWDCSSVWTFEAEQLSDEAFRYISLHDWFSSAMPLMETKYRQDLVAGLIQSIGSTISSSAEVVFDVLLEYLSPTSSHLLTIIGVYRDLQDMLQDNFTSNRIFIPTITACTKLASSESTREVLRSAESEGICSNLSTIIETASKSLSTIKSIERITAIASLVIAVVILPEAGLRKQASSLLPRLLTHRFPRIRSMTAERLYLALVEENVDVGEELEDMLLSTDWVNEGPESGSAKHVAALCSI